VEDPHPRLYLHSDVVASIDGRSKQGALRRREDLGLLLGDWALDPEDRPFAVAMDMVSGNLSASPVSVRFTEEGLGQVAKGLDELDYPYVIVGWYHTHLDLGCFLSDKDMQTQRGGFPHRHQVAVVVDPMRGQAAAFANGEEGPGTIRAAMASYDSWEPASGNVG
jgi:proteasome lid subunit RPN8/RPN11